MKGNDNPKVTKLAIDVILLFYTHSDQNGVVDIKRAADCAKKQLGIEIPTHPFTLKQEHLDFLMDRGVLPDTRSLLLKVQKTKLPRLPPPSETST